MHAEWRLTVADVLKRPHFQHASLTAGSRGLGRPVRWVHVLESAENGSFLNGGELILSTGLGFGESADRRLAYLEELIRRKAVGLCVELGAFIPDIPADMRELADHHDFPLIAFHQPVRFVDITLDLHELIVNRQTQALRRLESYSRDLQQLTLSANGLGRLLNHFQQAVQTQTFVWMIEGTPLFAPAMSQSVQQELTRLMGEVYGRGELSSAGGMLDLSGNKRILYQPIVAMGHVLAYLGAVLYTREADEYLLLTLDYTTTAMAQILLRRMFAEERARDSQNRLLDELIENRLGHEEQIRTLLRVQGSRPTPRYLAVIAEYTGDFVRFTDEADVPFHDLSGVFRSILSRHGFRSLMRSRGHRLYLLLIENTPLPAMKETARSALSELEQIACKALDPGVHIHFGASRVAEQFTEAGRHFQEAEKALAFQAHSGSPFFDDLGLFRLLLQVNDGYVLNSFVNDYLGPLIRHDREHGTQLVQTLRVLLDHNGSKQEASEQLYIRRQTLYHRLEKIRELLGDSFLSSPQRICLEVALRAWEWLSQGDQSRMETK